MVDFINAIIYNQITSNLKRRRLRRRRNYHFNEFPLKSKEIEREIFVTTIAIFCGCCCFGCPFMIQFSSILLPILITPTPSSYFISFRFVFSLFFTNYMMMIICIRLLLANKITKPKYNDSNITTQLL